MRQVIKKTANSDIPRSVVEIIAGVIFLAIGTLILRREKYASL